MTKDKDFKAIQRANGHADSKQDWNVKAVGGQVVYVQLAGMRHNFESNRFAHKHLMAPSKKGISADQKLERRLMHRVDKGGMQAWNPHKGGKAVGGLSRSEKYGNAASDKNTVIDLSVLDLDSVLVCMANALVAANMDLRTDKDVEIKFPKQCVRTVTAAGIGGAAAATFSFAGSDKIRVTAYRVGQKSYEIYHCVG